MPRLFVALSMPDHITDALSALQYGVDGARWRPVENFHMTLAFIGQTDRHGVSDAIGALSDIEAPGFYIRLSGTGFFGSRKPRAIWAGIESNPVLTAFQRKVDGALRQKGFELEARKFIPHVTLAYLKGARHDDVVSYCAANELFSTEEFPVNEYHLYSSVLGGRASHYEIEASWPAAPPKIGISRVECHQRNHCSE